MLQKETVKLLADLVREIDDVQELSDEQRQAVWGFVMAEGATLEQTEQIASSPAQRTKRGLDALDKYQASFK